ncbi:MAG TPA: hypothetical protein EYP53_04810, partial [Candidatus Latescibacteria bacterium]|nr:hypothetical protein [Candidatus Latescibacterota bacterium]
MKVPSEEKLIICLSRKVLDGEWTREARTLLGRDLNWRYVKRRADEGGVSGLLWRNLKLLRADSPIPSNILKAFKVSYCRNLMGYAASVEVLRDVLAGLTLADIPVLLLRGISLIKTVYGDEGLRDFSDVDLLLRGVDLPRTGEILRSLGFSSPREYPLLFCKDDLWLDLHLDLADTTRIRSRRLGARFDHEAIWKEATSIDVASSRVFILSPWDQIIFLSFHALK